MAFDVAIFGTLVLTPAEMTAWKRVVVDPTRYRTIARVFPRSPDLEPTTVGALLETLPAAGGYDLFRIEQDGGLYGVQGQFAERLFRKHARQLAALFMSATVVGIYGDVYFLGQGVREGYALQLSGRRPTLAILEGEEIDRRSRDPILDAISAHFQVASVATEVTPPPADVLPKPASSGRPLLAFPRGSGNGPGMEPDGSRGE
jgi:hypothetical protein